MATARSRLKPVLEAATTAEESARGSRVELEQYLEVLALDSTLIAGDASESTVDGTRLNLDAMRSDVVRLSQEATRAKTFRENIAIVIDFLGIADEHFRSETAYTTTMDAGDERFNAVIVAAREEERRRLSREIHDGPAQVLTNAIYAVQFVEQVAKRTPSQVGEELTRVRDLLKDGVTEVRRFMFDLRPTMLEDLGLGPTFKRYVGDYTRFFGRTVDLHVDADLPALTPDQDLTVFRVMQEALQNIHKHAGVTATATVSLTHGEGGLDLVIRDDGLGFEPGFASAFHGSGSGLPGMRERAQLAGGTIAITSVIGEGTTVHLHLRSDDRDDRSSVRALV